MEATCEVLGNADEKERIGNAAIAKAVYEGIIEKRSK
jgi:hypothetical protein